MPESFYYHFALYQSTITLCEAIPQCIQELSCLLDKEPSVQALVVCDENTDPLARELFKSYTAGETVRILTLPSGEEHKNWASVEVIIHAAKEKKQNLGRDDLFIGIGGGVICDCTAFAASIYMRGVKLALIPTTLLCMVDAAIGGKTGFNLAGIKNLAGTFYPAGNVIIAPGLLATLPQREWKSGIAELIKTAVIDRDPAFFNGLTAVAQYEFAASPEKFQSFIKKAILVKASIVENDTLETCENGRILLNLGHSFGHALESAIAPGTISHGEAVAWGIAKSCELGLELGITPPDRAQAIVKVLNAWGFETSNSLLKKPDNNAGKMFREALFFDKKKKAGKLRFVVPAEFGVVLVEENNCITGFINSLLHFPVCPE